MLRPRVCDPAGPAWTRLLVPLAGVALVVLGPFVPLGPGCRAAAALFGMAMLFATRLVQPRFAARAAVLNLGDDHVDVRAGVLSQRIRAADVLAASTARAAGGPALAVVRRDAATRPVLLEVDDEAALDGLRRSLKLGHFGFGEIAWPTRRRSSPAASLLAVGGWTIMAVAAACEDAALCLELALVVIPLSAVIFLAGAVLRPPAQRIVLSAHAVTIFERRGQRSIPYADIGDVWSVPHGLRLETRRGLVIVPTQEMTADEREHVRAQIQCAVLRARGLGPPAPTFPASIAPLAPRGEGARAWLERVDATAVSLGDRGEAYRRVAVGVGDLWSTLENPDAPKALRAASARILARIAPEEAPARVAVVLASERDVTTRACIRIVLEDDVDVAVRALARLDVR